MVLYGHPCYEGVREHVLRQVFAARARARLSLRHHADPRGAVRDGRLPPMIRVLSVFGTRPEAIKMAPVVHALRGATRSLRERRLRLGPAPSDAGPGARRLRVRADHDLDLMTPGQSPAEVTARVLERLPPLLRADPARRPAGAGRHHDELRGGVRRLPRARSPPVTSRRVSAPATATSRSPRR